MKLDDLFSDGKRIPSLPQVYFDFVEAVEDPDTTFEELAGIIECDLGLTAHLLKMVNSPFFGFLTPVETIPHAISVLGNNEINELVLAVCVIDRFKNVSPKILDMQLFWEHSIGCGLAAKVIAKHYKKVNPDSVFVGGLLHDIGRLIICISVPNLFSEIFLKGQNEKISLLQAEKDILGFGHDEVGGELLKRWNLPKVHEEAVRFHHSPGNASLFKKEASTLNIANSITQSLVLGSSGELLDSEIKLESREILNINAEENFSKIGEEVKELYQNTIQIFLQSC